jgi:CO/xanthine dehydrogenase Mo-binding subunit
MTIHGSMQCPYYVHKAIKALLQLSDERVRVVQTETGGGSAGRRSIPTSWPGMHRCWRRRRGGR